MPHPKFSIIMPVYNRGPAVLDSVASVLQQSREDFELLIIDDGSTDDTAQVLGTLHDNRISVLHQNNRGPGAARNLGLKIARGTYIAYCDHDDILCPDHLKILSSCLERDSSLGIVFGNHTILSPDAPQPFSTYQRLKPLIFAGKYPLFETVDPFIPAVAMHVKETIHTVGYFSEAPDIGRGMEDWDYFLRITRHYPARFIDEHVARYTLHSNNLSSRLDMNRMLTVFIKHQLDSHLRAALPYELYYFDALLNVLDDAQEPPRYPASRTLLKYFSEKDPENPLLSICAALLTFLQNDPDNALNYLHRASQRVTELQEQSSRQLVVFLSSFLSAFAAAARKESLKDRTLFRICKLLKKTLYEAVIHRWQLLPAHQSGLSRETAIQALHSCRVDSRSLPEEFRLHYKRCLEVVCSRHFIDNLMTTLNTDALMYNLAEVNRLLSTEGDLPCHPLQKAT